MIEPSGVVPPPLIPPGKSGYELRSLQKSELLNAPDGRAVAQLADIPDDLSGEVGFRLSEVKPVDPDKIAYSIIASVRYRGSGKTVIVTTSKASPLAAKQQTSLGNKTIQLDDGTPAWQTTGIPGEWPNQIVFTRDDLIVTIACQGRTCVVRKPLPAGCGFTHCPGASKSLRFLWVLRRT